MTPFQDVCRYICTKTSGEVGMKMSNISCPSALPILNPPESLVVERETIALIFHFVGNKLLETDYIFFAQLVIGKNFFTFIKHVFLTIGFYYAPYTRYMLRKTE